MVKKIILTAASCFLLLLFLKSEMYGNWFDQKVWIPKEAIDEQMEHLAMKDRLEMRIGKQYYMMEQIMAVLDKAHEKNPVILLPPNEYLRKQNITDLIIPEPSQFYYYTGLHAVWTSSPDVRKANWALIIQNGNMRFEKIENQQMLDQLLNSYKGYNTI
jgi:hypothetical protein